jgi:hypothetical protein
MQLRRFQGQEKPIIQEAVLIAEESTSDFFKLSNSQWRRSRYDILTLEALREEEISSSALAQLAKYTCCLPGRELKSAHFDLYRICLQDHNILGTLEKQVKLALLPLLIYVITHELVHIIRFSHFHQLFDATSEEKTQEEKRVHSLTREILRPYKCPDLEEIALYYQNLDG